MPRIAIALGSNIDPEANLRRAAALLRERFPGIRFSRIYRTAPQDVTDQPDFLNAAAVFQSDAPPEAIAEALRDIEEALGKDPPYRFGPRTIDIDILLFGNSQFSIFNSQLIIPHPRLHQRRFVLEPLVELIDPEEHHPVLDQPWKTLLKNVQDQDSHIIATSLP